MLCRHLHVPGRRGAAHFLLLSGTVEETGAGATREAREPAVRAISGADDRRHRPTSKGSLPPADTWSTFCECNGLLLHDAHGCSLLHKRWAAAQKNGGAGNTTTVTDDIIRRLQSEPAAIRQVGGVAGFGSNSTSPGGSNVIAADHPTAVTTSRHHTWNGVDRRTSDTGRGRDGLHARRFAL
ncbi:hypothetical protein HPB52_024172 [Rhipicephalus sanguineus]|uniref:Uncharacterized protein n=1 Tax=Rhipicephalus sanguineus TaxID=34632 RepID=A0A9D4T3G5_RHISA|nr:hypothetical protein HPB52_024172 [Rhipicephalus sanguineus]